MSELSQLPSGSQNTSAPQREFVLPEFVLRGQLSADTESRQILSSRLCPPRSLSFKVDDVFLLDCHDCSSIPRIYRPHMYNGYLTNVPYETKLDRMTKWQEVLLFLNSRMIDLPPSYGEKEVMEALRNFSLPRAEFVELDAASKGLRELFARLEYRPCSEPPHPFIVDWAKLIQDAAAGRIVGEWSVLKAEQKLALDLLCCTKT